MSESKHTPRPWEMTGASVSGVTQGLIPIEGSEAVHVSGKDYMTSNGKMSTKSASETVCWLNGDPSASESVKANAALICAAPLIPECEKMIETLFDFLIEWKDCLAGVQMTEEDFNRESKINKAHTLLTALKAARGSDE